MSIFRANWLFNIRFWRTFSFCLLTLVWDHLFTCVSISLGSQNHVAFKGHIKGFECLPLGEMGKNPKLFRWAICKIDVGKFIMTCFEFPTFFLLEVSNGKAIMETLEIGKNLFFWWSSKQDCCFEKLPSLHPDTEKTHDVVHVLYSLIMYYFISCFRWRYG